MFGFQFSQFGEGALAQWFITHHSIPAYPRALDGLAVQRPPRKGPRHAKAAQAFGGRDALRETGAEGDYHTGFGLENVYQLGFLSA